MINKLNKIVNLPFITKTFPFYGILKVPVIQISTKMRFFFSFPFQNTLIFHMTSKARKDISIYSSGPEFNRVYRVFIESLGCYDNTFPLISCV